MTTILNQMGIQQWRLRPESSTTASAPELATTTASELETHEQSQQRFQPIESARVARMRSQDESVDAVSPQKLAITSPAALESRPPTPVPAPVPMAIPSRSREYGAKTLGSALQGQGNSTLDAIGSLDWQALQALIDGQSQCPTCGVNNSNLGAGDANANWLFISDAPTPTDLELQQLFSGRAGQLYEAMLLAVGCDRTSVYTTSIFKCVASGDLSASPDCDKLLNRQIELVQPKVIIAFGEFASQSIAKSNESLETLRTQDLICHRSKVPIVASYSPLQLLEEPLLKAKAWQDLKKCIAITR